jgi:hypothetical protein
VKLNPEGYSPSNSDPLCKPSRSEKSSYRRESDPAIDSVVPLHFGIEDEFEFEVEDD